uniref:Putative sigma 54 type regulator n=1 Tax=Brevibacterium sp. HCU TaxID=133406 RepID=Q93QH0_9MICO|nr:putative sigma 54 type regulator [Brevibacterium sp. HCU]
MIGPRTHLTAVDTERGSDLSEEAVGTNGLGTALTTGSGIQIRGAEHYAHFYANAVCTGEPVLHPESGQGLGAIVLSGDESRHSNLLLPLLRGLVARMQLKILRNPDDFNFSSLPTIGDSKAADQPYDLFISSDRERINTGSTHLPKMRDHTAPVVGSVSVEGLDVGFARDHNGLHTLRLLGDATSAQVLHGETNSSRIVRDERWEGCFAETVSVLRSQRSIVLVGEAGVGKATLAALGMRAVDPHRPLNEIDAVRAKVDGWDTVLRSIAENLDAGKGLLIRGAEGLTSSERTEIRSLLNATADPFVVLTATIDFDDQSTLTSNATVAPTIVIPPLRQNPERVAPLWDALAGPGWRPARLTAPARKALSQYIWPGNLRELHHIAAMTVQNSAGSDITVDMLPDTVRSAPSGATMIERAERHALLQALQQADGNRSQAAAILGVSRATIYRKIKQYKLQE